MWICFISKENYLVLSFLIPMFVILLIKTIILVPSLYKIRLALRKRDNSEGELKILRTTAPSITLDITENGTVNCLSSDTNNGTICTSLELLVKMEPQNGTLIRIQVIRLREALLEDFILKVNINRNNSTALHFSISRNSMQIATDSFPDTNPPNSTVTLISGVITIFASNELIGELMIVFRIENTTKYEDGVVQCVYLINNEREKWSTEGISTVMGINGSIECTINHLTRFAVLFSSVQCGRHSSEISGVILAITSYTLLAISLVFLVTSFVIFILSGKKLFSVDINIMHFNHTVGLLLAVSCFIFLVQSASESNWLCTAVAFFLQFLWTNVFVSSLSIGILVFYTIWTVGLKHEARKLNKYLIPFSWCLSLVWALVWLAYGQLTNQYIAMDTQNKSIDGNCQYSCFLNSENNLHFLIPVYLILLVNTSLLIVCLFKIRLALKLKNRSENELSRLRRVSIGGLLLTPALSIPFLIALPLTFTQNDDTVHTVFEWVFIIPNAPIGIIHFMVITYQIPEARNPKYCRPNVSQQPTTSATGASPSEHTLNRKLSLHFNVVHSKAHKNKDSTVYVNDWVETRL